MCRRRKWDWCSNAFHVCKVRIRFFFFFLCNFFAYKNTSAGFLSEASITKRLQPKTCQEKKAHKFPSVGFKNNKSCNVDPSEPFVARLQKMFISTDEDSCKDHPRRLCTHPTYLHITAGFCNIAPTKIPRNEDLFASWWWWSHAAPYLLSPTWRPSMN